MTRSGLQEVAHDLLDAQITGATEAPIHVRGDDVFLAAVVKELLRNARKAIFRRQQDETSEYLVPHKGMVTVNVCTCEPDDDLPTSHVVLSIADNGDAANVDGLDARNRLEAAWKQAQASGEPMRDGKVGLRFIFWVISKHDGCVTVSTHDNQTVFRICLPTCNMIS